MTAVEFLVAALWLGPFFLLFRLHDRSPRLVDFPPAEGPLVSVVIPARNEETTIRTALASVMASKYQPLEIIVVDDCSTDGTSDIVLALADTDDRVRLIDGAALPDGWFGKPWACVQGYRAARGDVILFTDADTRHAPTLIGHAVSALHSQKADLVTVAPHQLCVTFWERVIMPQVWVLLGTRFHPRSVNRGSSSRSMIANGQFIMMSRRSYEAVGTHERVKEAVAEDLAMAQAVRGGGGKVFFAFATDLMETRMYRSLGQLVEGWSKNLYLGGRQSLRDFPVLRFLFPMSFAFVGLFWLVPPIWLFATLFSGWPGTLGAASAMVLSVSFWALVSQGMKIPAAYGLIYPLGVIGLLGIAGRSIARGRKVEWRGRWYGVSNGEA